ncbi:TPA: hypothetical protein ACGO4V_001958, partial [Streptococcus suis]
KKKQKTPELFNYCRRFSYIALGSFLNELQGLTTPSLYVLIILCLARAVNKNNYFFNFLFKIFFKMLLIYFSKCF